ncbi:LysE/ArgO family amino acid transporter [Variovorax sp. RCC_210]|uniref:LysE/ArgO family amino acid transporter n=1 Tax=Variovorax sp. RCC_210 TaxID=3239217 RepID=UPI003525907A
MNGSFLEGLLLGAGLLIAIGPKDAFVIRSSIRGSSVLMLVAICALSDALLIAVGVAGLGVLVASSRWAMVSAMVFSIGYLIYFGLQALAAAFRPVTAFDGAAASGDTVQGAGAGASVVRMALFHSLLTPYAWLDTVLVIGAVSATKAGEAKLAFAAGAMSASFIWFVFLTVGSRLAASLLRARRAWQLLDLAVALSMMVLAAKLLSDYPWQTV